MSEYKEQLKALKDEFDKLAVELDALRLKRSEPGYNYTKEIELTQKQVAITKAALDLNEEG